jgi:subtilisin family serine protease
MAQLVSSRRALIMLGLAAAGAMVAAVAASVPAEAATGDIQAAGGATAVGGSYIVTLTDGTSDVDTTAQRLASRYGGTVRQTYDAALRGFELSIGERAARRLAADRSVSAVEQNHTISLAATQANPPSWGLDRIDQRNLPLNRSYTFPNTASSVHAYIIDTGIRFSHRTFGGRAASGFDAIDGGRADDCNGHGTHVAGTVGGNEFGVAKRVQLVAVRVLDCNGSGSTASVVAGINWVTRNRILPAVANMSLGGGPSGSIDTAVSRSISAGVTYAIAAGNSNANACNFSPARVPAAITVGATDRTDRRASFSNFGTCLDIFAPGVAIVSSVNTSDTATASFSGTSMATPHVAGAAALVLQANPGFSPAQVRSRLVADATTGHVIGAGTGSPNRLLFVH